MTRIGLPIRILLVLLAQVAKVLATKAPATLPTAATPRMSTFPEQVPPEASIVVELATNSGMTTPTLAVLQVVLVV